MDLAWTDKYPSSESLRHEVNAMVQSVAEAVLDRLPPTQVAGIYFKGSAQKEWTSPVDYVPEVSDVDIHLLLRDEGAPTALLGTIEDAFAIQSQTEHRYRSKIADPIHAPRPQLLVLNRLLSEPDYSPSPREAVTVVHGEDYPSASYDDRKERQLAAQRLLAHAEVLDTIPLHVVDKPGAYLLAALRNLTWRVSPLGPRVLLLLGTPPERAWSLNRTQIISALSDHGQHEIAEQYRRFYLSAWKYFLSGYADSAAGRDVIAAGVELMKRGVATAEGLGRSA